MATATDLTHHIQSIRLVDTHEHMRPKPNGLRMDPISSKTYLETMCLPTW